MVELKKITGVISIHEIFTGVYCITKIHRGGPWWTLSDWIFAGVKIEVKIHRGSRGAHPGDEKLTGDNRGSPGSTGVHRGRFSPGH